MHRVCGRTVYYPSMLVGKSLGYNPRRILGLSACAQNYEVVNSLYYKCTQLLHNGFINFVSVNQWLYPLSTQPIKTTTF